MMNPTVTIVPYGSLRNTVAMPTDVSLETPRSGPWTLTEVIAATGIPAEQVQLVMVNHRAVSIDSEVQAGDRIALFPREYAFFVDWYAYRLTTKN